MKGAEASKGFNEFYLFYSDIIICEQPKLKKCKETKSKFYYFFQPQFQVYPWQYGLRVLPL